MLTTPQRTIFLLLFVHHDMSRCHRYLLLSILISLTGAALSSSNLRLDIRQGMAATPAIDASPPISPPFLLSFPTIIMSSPQITPSQLTSALMPTFYIGGITLESRPTVTSRIPSTITTACISPLPKHAHTSTWTFPPHVTNVVPFNITKNPGPKVNIAFASEMITSTPASHSSTQAYTINGVIISLQSSQKPVTWNSPSMPLRVFYPSGSRDPSNKPIGGSQFYATPIPLTGSKNITFGYSVFFPISFDWVLGGKLPGLYGGHTSCSGGNDAATCFSTRLMWRPGGAGELYLYAPRDKQTAALCTDPQSVCDSTWGVSVGRGSFYFKPGAWTYLEQTVVLNTPGKPDGTFTLLVNNRTVIHRKDIYYRDAASEDPSTTSNGMDGGLLGSGGLLGQLLNNGLPLADSLTGNVRPEILDIHSQEARFSVLVSAANVSLHCGDCASLVSNCTPPPVAEGSPISPANPNLLDVERTMSQDPIGFSGIFFSTFFGGHAMKYATPKDQYTWFKDFSLRINS